MKMELGLQLYSLRDYMTDDFKGLLKKVKQAGFDGAEFAGFHDIPADEMKKTLDEIGLKSAGTHTPFPEIRDHLDEVIAYNKTIGTRYIIIPHYTYNTVEDVKEVIRVAKIAGPKVKAAGMDFLYHNHDTEFLMKFDGKTIMEMFLEELSADEMNFELDLFWVRYAGLDPLEVMEQYGDRLVTVHLKDMNNFEEKKMTEVGTGCIDVAGILAGCAKRGFPWVIVEQDEIYIDRYESIHTSAQNAKKIMQAL